MERIFRTWSFTRWMRRAGVSDKALASAVTEMAQGLVDADLGGHLLKKRIALPGQGKRGGARTIVATKRKGRWFFLFGFEKSDRAHVDKDELKALQELAEAFLALDDQQLVLAMVAGEIVELIDENNPTQKSHPG